MILKLDSTNFWETLNENRMRLCIVDFYADWCHPCKLISPVLERLSEKHKHVMFVKVDNDSNTDIIEKVRVTNLPTLLFVKGNKTVATIIGHYENLSELIENKINEYAFLI